MSTDSVVEFSVVDDLVSNGNGMPDFDLSLGTAFRVIEHRAHMDETEKVTEKVTENIVDSPSSLAGIHREIYHLLSLNLRIKYSELQEKTGKSRGYLSRVVAGLIEEGYISRIGSDRKGQWQILKSLTQK